MRGKNGLPVATRSRNNQTSNAVALPISGTRNTKYQSTQGVDIGVSPFSDAHFVSIDTSYKSITAMLE